MAVRRLLFELDYPRLERRTRYLVYVAPRIKKNKLSVLLYLLYSSNCIHLTPGLVRGKSFRIGDVRARSLWMCNCTENASIPPVYLRTSVDVRTR